MSEEIKETTAPTEEGQEQAFVIESNLSGRKSDLAVKDFATVKETALKIIASLPVFEIFDNDSKKRAKEIRAKLNNAVKLIDRRRIDDVADFTRNFENQCDELAALFIEHSKKFDEKIKAYENLQPKPTKYSLTVKSYDSKVIEEIRAYAIKLKCEVK